MTKVIVDLRKQSKNFVVSMMFENPQTKEVQMSVMHTTADNAKEADQYARNMAMQSAFRNWNFKQSICTEIEVISSTESTND